MANDKCPDVLMENRPRDGEQYVMECNMMAVRIDGMGEARSERRVTWQGFATSEVVDAMLAAIKGVLEVNGDVKR